VRAGDGSAHLSLGVLVGSVTVLTGRLGRTTRSARSDPLAELAGVTAQALASGWLWAPISWTFSHGTGAFTLGNDFSS